MKSILQGIPQVSVYLDDILITGWMESEHLRQLEEVLTRLKEAGLCLNRSKCEFMVKSVSYLGHQINLEGLHPLPDKVAAVLEAPHHKM